MPKAPRQRVVWATLVIIVVAVTNFTCPLSANKATGDDSGATISGTVRYHIDQERVWRYRRYYVEDHRTGYLAEAVVALTSAALRRGEYALPDQTIHVDQKDYRFIPETVAIRAGQSIKFSNSDNANHNVHSTNPLHVFNISIPTGGALVETFPRAGGIRRPIQLGCVFHDQMRAWIFVFDHPFFQVTGADGRYNLSGVPPGEYRLEMFHPAGQLRWSKTITVDAGATLAVDVDVSPDDLVKESTG